MALFRSSADDGIATAALALLAGIGPGAGVAVVARLAVGDREAGQAGAGRLLAALRTVARVPVVACVIILAARRLAQGAQGSRLREAGKEQAAHEDRGH
jgi:hypothetical protein